MCVMLTKLLLCQHSTCSARAAGQQLPGAILVSVAAAG